MREVAVIGVGMNRFGKYPEKGIKQLVEESVTKTLEDAGVKKSQIEAAFVGNAAAGLMTGQEMIRGQTVLSALGIDAIPIYNVENACASSSSAFNMAWMSVGSLGKLAGGQADMSWNFFMSSGSLPPSS